MADHAAEDPNKRAIEPAPRGGVISAGAQPFRRSRLAMAIYATLVALEAVRLLFVGVVLVVWGIVLLADMNPAGFLCLAAVLFFSYSLVVIYRAPFKRPRLSRRLFLIAGHLAAVGYCVFVVYNPAAPEYLAVAVFLGLPSMTSVTALVWMPHLLVPVGVCPNCEYPLKGLRGPSCPECGERIEPVGHRS